MSAYVCIIKTLRNNTPISTQLLEIHLHNLPSNAGLVKFWTMRSAQQKLLPKVLDLSIHIKPIGFAKHVETFLRKSNRIHGTGKFTYICSMFTILLLKKNIHGSYGLVFYQVPMKLKQIVQQIHWMGGCVCVCQLLYEQLWGNVSGMGMLVG